MTRVIKRYGSRKLYDTEESRYVSLEEIGDWVRSGQQVQVLDNQSGEDVTSQTLTLVILENGKRRGSTVSSDFLHDLIRRGEIVVSTGVQSLQEGVDRLIQAGVEHVAPLRELRDETAELRRRLDSLEQAITNVEHRAAESAAPAPPPRPVTPPAARSGTARTETRKKGV